MKNTTNVNVYSFVTNIIEVKTVHCQNFYRKTSQTARKMESGNLMDHLMMRNKSLRTVSPVYKERLETMLTGVDKSDVAAPPAACMRSPSISAFELIVAIKLSLLERITLVHWTGHGLFFKHI